MVGKEKLTILLILKLYKKVRNVIMSCLSLCFQSYADLLSTSKICLNSLGLIYH